ncbi:MAG: inorganic phosphate transporter [Candidatus Dadabacteria bacterium]|nr:inorganic phosphate transporter [Candidatus Dadabacteria bacterium]NIS10213.1 inorganic phosphate transporter [Candidatus Dadabacteria bacterium]NIV42658.1 inorganic phosphate transporter [Candidatus Dadabacteria bacterium]NIX16581.1 inorganic phosphate transporter [Candidatus Dadabacteria bacterium]NIY23128.1 inorganic phosphate transporter [Candidatus Dadabacteria bacterium]
MELIIFIVVAVIFLSYSNGANDNFKGVATLFGSRTVNYKKALYWATAATFLGSLFSIYLSNGLISAFSGKGLVSHEIISNIGFIIAIAMGAAGTVMLATLLGIPISTTHSLIGALIGAGIASVGSVNISTLGQSFFLPLAVSPFLSFGLTALVYPVFKRARRKLGVEKETCVCVSEGSYEPVMMRTDGSAVLKTTGLRITAGRLGDCEQRYNGKLLGIGAQAILDWLHFLSSGMVSFARGLNDTPKIVALLVSAKAVGIDLKISMLVVGVAMAAGGLLSARKVAATMSDKIVPMNHGQGFTANLITALLVTVASKFGIPVSTTHVSCGSLFGLGAVTKQGRWKVIRTIIFAWFITLPAAALFSSLVYLIVS